MYEELKNAAMAAIEREDCDRFLWRDDAQLVLNVLADRERLLAALKRARPFVEKDVTAAVKDNFGSVGNSEWANYSVDIRDLVDAAISQSERAS